MRKFSFMGPQWFALCALIGHATLAQDSHSELRAALTKWNSLKLQDYSYSVESSQTVFTQCLEFLPVRLTVRSGQVISGIYLRDRENRTSNQPIPASCLRSFYTIEGAFNYLERNGGHRFKVTFDPTFGYPSTLEDMDTLDGDFPLKIWNLGRI